STTPLPGALGQHLAGVARPLCEWTKKVPGPWRRWRRGGITMRKLGIRAVLVLSGMGLLLAAAAPLRAQGPTAQVRGRVVAKETGEPLASANVVLRRRGGDV